LKQNFTQTRCSWKSRWKIRRASETRVPPNRHNVWAN